MKRALTHLTIAAYLAALGYGVACHTLQTGTQAHPAMYFLVWDMYCGWSAMETRLHLIGEGRSGRHYELSPPPWGEFRPFGGIGRIHYDVSAQFADRLAACTLEHSAHEPIHRILLVEESWSKKYNLSDRIWAQRFLEEKRPQSYYHVRAILNPDGRYVRRMPGWSTLLSNQCLMNNPRLMSDVAKGHSFLAVNPSSRHPQVTPAAYQSAAPPVNP